MFSQQKNKSKLTFYCERLKIIEKMNMEVDNTEKLFVFIAHYQPKEFVGQKAIDHDIEEEVAGDSTVEVLDNIWLKAKSLIKREIVVDGEKFSWAETENPERNEIGNFVIFQDKVAKKTYLVSQITADVLRKMRNKHVNVMVHVYGRAISNRTMHVKMTAAILEPAQRDRAGAHSTVLLTELARKLKDIHGKFLSGNMASWTMWANAIHSAGMHQQEDLLKKMPPAHLIHLFRTIPMSEAEVMRSTQNGLKIAGNLNDSYLESVRTLREEFIKMKETALRAYDLFDLRLTATEEMLAANGRLVASMDDSLRIEVNAVSLEEERQITDIPDVDHN